jgi:eukaryotic-like serine/threonine-protein kinase
MAMRDIKPPLSEERVAAYLRGELPATERAAVEAAIDREPQWLTVVALLARSDPGSPPASDTDAERDEDDPREPPPAASVAASVASFDAAQLERVEREHAARLRPGDRLGRYEVEGPLGRGGMGMVYAARDPELDRRVALKLLRGGDPRGQTRLLREARALAKLSDRHVITIHDVGTWQGRVFLAMELLAGPTLQAWRATASRTWQQVLAVFVDAGRGLAAAHAAGLVHRDFKPANVMLGADGRVVVLDFGLAHLVDAEGPSLHDDEPSASSTDAEARPTRTGQVLGTPAYMAPEQQRGEPCGPAADQFSFCVALYEALHGQLPPQATLPRARARYGPATGRLPRRLGRLLARGLALDPQARHPSLRRLVDALAAVLRPRARWWAAGLLTGAAGSALAWAAQSDRQPPAPCTGAAQALAATFDDAHALVVTKALADTGRPWSARVSTEVDHRLHGFANAWIAEHEATCRATRIDGAQSEDVLDLRMRCLDRRRRSLGALVDVLATADAQAAAHAVQAVDALPPVAGCRDVEALRTPVPPPEDPEGRALADALFDQLAHVEALRQAARYPEAARLAADAVAQAVALGHAPTEADARLAAGWVHTDRGEHDAAELELRAALHAAEIGRHDEAVTLAWNRLAWVVGYKLAHFDEGRRLAQHAAAWSQRLGRAPYHELSWLRTLGWIEHEAGASALALERFEQALAVAERLPPDDPVSPQELALVLNGLGAAALAVADLPRAQQSFERAAQQLEDQLGPDHPDVARVRNNLAALLRAQGQADASRVMFEHNLRVFEATFGDAHEIVGQTLINLAVAELDLGRHADAEHHAERAIAVLTAAHDPRHPLVAKAHTIRGDARIQLQRPLEAIADLELALDIERETLGAEHPSVGIIESNLGGAYYELDRHHDAAAHQARALEILEAGLGSEHPNLALVLVSLGLTRRAQGRRDDALALFRRAEAQADASVRPNALTRIGETLLDQGHTPAALEALERARTLQAEIETDPGLAGDTLMALARARWAVGDHQAAHTAARDAAAAYKAGGAAESEADARRWLTVHDPAPQ